MDGDNMDVDTWYRFGVLHGRSYGVVRSVTVSRFSQRLFAVEHQKQRDIFPALSPLADPTYCHK